MDDAKFGLSQNWKQPKLEVAKFGQCQKWKAKIGKPKLGKTKIGKPKMDFAKLGDERIRQLTVCGKTVLTHTTTYNYM